VVATKYPESVRVTEFANWISALSATTSNGFTLILVAGQLGPRGLEPAASCHVQVGAKAPDWSVVDGLLASLGPMVEAVCVFAHRDRATGAALSDTVARERTAARVAAIRADPLTVNGGFLADRTGRRLVLAEADA
jgi:hypothetical protein